MSDNNDDIFGDMNTWRKQMVDDALEDSSTAAGAGGAGVAAVAGAAVAVALGLTGIAIPAIALGAAAIAYKRNKSMVRYGMRDLFEKIKSEE